MLFCTSVRLGNTPTFSCNRRGILCPHNIPSSRGTLSSCRNIFQPTQTASDQNSLGVSFYPRHHRPVRPLAGSLSRQLTDHGSADSEDTSTYANIHLLVRFLHSSTSLLHFCLLSPSSDQGSQRSYQLSRLLSITRSWRAACLNFPLPRSSHSVSDRPSHL